MVGRRPHPTLRVLDTGAMTKTTRLSILATAVLTSVALAGCNDEPDRPPIFRIDQIRYWWEDDYLIVNVTFTNQANFTPIGPIPPVLHVSVYSREATAGRIGEQTSYVYVPNARTSIILDFSTTASGPWLRRWTQDADVGPILIAPGQTLNVEVALQPGIHFMTEDNGYHHIQVRMASWYSPGDKSKSRPDADYYTGCFNDLVQEFYGIKNPGPDCGIWDCTGSWTRHEYFMRDLRGTYRADCSATEHIGPQYLD